MQRYEFILKRPNILDEINHSCLIYVKKVCGHTKNFSVGTIRLSKSLYLCNVFFIVLDLRLTKIRNSAEFHFFCPVAKYLVDDEASDEAGNNINSIMGKDVNRCKTHKYIERQHGEDEFLAACVAGKKYHDGGDAYVTARESCCGALACIVCDFQQMIEEAVAPSRGCHTVAMCQEIVG